MILRAVNTKK